MTTPPVILSATKQTSAQNLANKTTPSDGANSRDSNSGSSRHRFHLPDPKLLFPIILATGLAIVAIVSTWLYCDMLENQRIDAEAVTLQPDLTVSAGQTVRVSDFLANLNGTLVEDFNIDTETIGEQTVTFEYINIKNRKRNFSFIIQVQDVTPPRIIGGNAYTVNANYEGDLTNLMISGDDRDDNPHREVIGDYDVKIADSYDLEYSITDASGNQTKKPFTLQVAEPTPDDSTDDVSVPTKLPIADVIKQHKTNNTQIGIDVSQWQGKIDWTEVKSAGVEFAFIRIGYQAGYDGEYILDPYFITNIESANQLGLPVGVYFYSYAHNTDQAREQAEWVRDQLVGYTAELGVAFDWESWNTFNTAGMSFYTINKVASTFLDTLSSAGYPGFLYGSKYYLEQIWSPSQFQIWLAQYYDHVTYNGEYQIWQMSDNGEVPGINGSVDIDIRYLNH